MCFATYRQCGARCKNLGEAEHCRQPDAQVRSPDDSGNFGSKCHLVCRASRPTMSSQDAVAAADERAESREPGSVTAPGESTDLPAGLPDKDNTTDEEPQEESAATLEELAERGQHHYQKGICAIRRRPTEPGDIELLRRIF